MDKILNLLNPKKWIEGFLTEKFVQKAAVGVSGYVISALTSPTLAPKIQKALEFVGASVDFEVLKASISAALIGLFMGLLNMAKHGPLK